MFSSIVRPQANGQVEAVRKTIKHNLKMKLEDLKGIWADELPEVLHCQNLNWGNLVLLAYGYKAIGPVEIGVGSLRRDNYNSD